MKSAGVLLGTFLGLLILLTPPAQAATFQVGLRYWFADWTISNFKAPILGQEFTGSGFRFQFDPYTASLAKSNADGLGLYGANLGLSFNKWGFAATYFTGDYDIRIKDSSTHDAVTPAGAEQTALVDLKTSTTRSDIDLSVYWRYYPNFSFFLGYKYIEYSYGKQSLDLVSDYQVGGVLIRGVRSTLVVDSLNSQVHGPSIGFFGSQTLGKRFYSFGGASYLPYLIGAQDTKDLTQDDTGWAYNVEVGIGLNFPRAHFLPSVSYRFQQFGGFKDLRDTFHGIVVSTAFSF